MKKLTLFTIITALVIEVNAQQIKKVEYFFDTDPGVGAATAQILPSPAANISNYDLTVNVTSLTNGFHKFYVRCMDNTGKWSVTTKRLFYKQDIPVVLSPKVKELEYFIDTDPGVGNATAVSFTAASDWADKTFTVDLTSVTDGFHKLYVRTLDDLGKWSLTSKKQFYRHQVMTATNAKIKAFEYFIDTDPGVGSATRISVATPAANIADRDLVIDLSSVTSGFHKLVIRAVDDQGHWSTSATKTFYMDVIPVTENLKISEVEYFIDADPGVGNGTNLSFTQGANIDITSSIDLTALTKGFHKLNIRAKDNLGRWSVASSRSFYMDVAPVATTPNLVKGEYFIDTDPGLGNGTPITFTASAEISNQTFTVDLNSVTAGFHKLNIRYKDARGNWSVTTKSRFYKDASVPAVATQIKEVSYYVGQGDEIDMNNFIKVADFTPGLDVQDFIFPVDLAGKEVGNYYLYAFAKDFSGRYTTLAIDSFKICDNVARAKFSYTVASRTVTFVDESELAANYNWDFGDGYTSIEPSPEHTYFQNGKYNVCLTISNDCNASVFAIRLK